MTFLSKSLGRAKSLYWGLRAVLAGVLITDTWDQIGPVDILILCHDNTRGLTIDGKAYSQLLDPIREELVANGHSVAVLARKYSVLTGEKAHGAPHSYNRASIALAVAKRVARVVPWMRRIDVASEREINFWERMLSATEAKAVLLIGAPPELCIAGHRRGVPVVELLHGFRYSSIPSDYDQRESKSLPKHILTLDDYSHQTLKALCDRGVQISRVKHPSLESSSIEKVRITSKCDDPFIEHDLGGSPITTVMVALQYGYGRDGEAGGHFPNGLFPDVLTDFVKESSGEIEWVFRLHPVQLRDRRYRRHLNIIRELQKLTNVWDFENSQDRLSALLPKVDVLLTPASAIASEALSMGVPVIFFDVRNSNLVSLSAAYADEIILKRVFFWYGSISDLTQLLRVDLRLSGLVVTNGKSGNPTVSDWLSGIVTQ